MFNRKPAAEDVAANEVITNHIAKMTTCTNKDEYSKMMDQYIQLTTLKSQNAPKPLSKDTLALVAGNLAGIMLIVGHERAHVVTSKALGFIMKAR